MNPRANGAATKLGLTPHAYEQRIINGEKWCWKCRRWRSREIDFHRCHSAADQRNAICKECVADARR